MGYLRKLEEFYFRYFAQSTIESEDIWLRAMVSLTMILTALTAVVFDVLLLPKLARVTLFIFAGEMGIFGLLWIIVFFYHNWRIKHESNIKI